jgi:hypothetical protein
MSSTCVVCVLLLNYRLLSPLQTELAINTHKIVADIHQNILRACEGDDGKIQVVSSDPSFTG